MPIAYRLAAFAPRTLAWERQELPEEPPPHFLLVRTSSTLISTGTELANWTGITADRATMGSDWTQHPYRPGYSLAGTVIAAGPDTEGFAVGQRVTASGPHASHALLDARRTAAIPDAVSDAAATFSTLGPIVLNGIRRATVALGDSTAIVGLGLIGQLAGRLAHLNGARPVVGVDPIAVRRERAIQLGFSSAWPAAADALSPVVDTGAVGGGYRVVIEATGIPDALRDALHLAAPEARVIALGSTRGTVASFDLYRDVHLKGVHLIGAHLRTHPEVATHENPWTELANRLLTLRLIASGDLPVEQLFSHRVLATQALGMYALLADRRQEAMGVVLDWAGLNWDGAGPMPLA